MANEKDLLEKQLKVGQKPFLKLWMKVVLVMAVVVIGIALWYIFQPSGSKQPIYQLGQVIKGDIRAKVSATGTLQPTNEIEVGSELSGTIDHVYVDYNDVVKKGQLLAELNTEKLTAQVLQSKAALQVAKAGVLEAEATLEEAIAQFDRMENIRKMTDGKLPSKADFISAEATKKRAQAAKTTALAEVKQAEATLEQDLTDLSKAKVHSPINGIVLDRSIEPGQTVAATMEAPVLFTLAEDLTKMELQVDVDEADVGQVKDGQNASFTVDAYPDVAFPALIRQVRYGSETTDGVVTYTTLLEVNNTDMKLRPGMTATADILVKEKLDVLMIPLAALRFTPALMGDNSQKEEKSLIESLIPRPPKRKNMTMSQPEMKDGKRQVWQLIKGQLESVMIKTGDTSGDMVEVLEGNLKQGDQVVVGVEVPLK